MSGNFPKRILFICYPGSDILRIVQQVRQSSGALSLDHICLSTTDIYEVSLDEQDVVLLDLKALQYHEIDAEELGDTLYTHIPVVLLGDTDDASSALEGIKAGAQDWILYENLTDSSLLNTIETAQRTFSNHRDLVVKLARYQNVVEDQSELIYRCSPDCTLTFVNQAFANYLGKSVSELEGSSFQQLSVPDEYEKYQQKIYSLTPASPTASHEKCIVNNGDVHWFHWSDKAFFDSNGIMLEVQSIGTDITEIRCAKQEALDGKKRFQSLYHNAPIMMQEVDMRGRILSVNRCWLESMGFECEDVIGQNALKYLHKSSRKQIDKIFKELQRSGNVRDVACRLINKTGLTINVMASATMDIEDEQHNRRILIVSKESDGRANPSQSETQRYQYEGQSSSRRH